MVARLSRLAMRSITSSGTASKFFCHKIIGCCVPQDGSADMTLSCCRILAKITE
jgi:hypothetical protein